MTSMRRRRFLASSLRSAPLGQSVILITDGAMHDGKPYHALSAGTRFHLATWTMLPGKAERAGG